MDYLSGYMFPEPGAPFRRPPPPPAALGLLPPLPPRGLPPGPPHPTDMTGESDTRQIFHNFWYLT